MKVSKIASAATLALMASLSAVGAGAEEYHGVLQFNSTLSRADVRAEAVIAARSENPNAEGANAGEPTRFASAASRDSVRSDAVAIARAGNVYGDGAMGATTIGSIGAVDRATVRAEARATARGDIRIGSL